MDSPAGPIIAASLAAVASALAMRVLVPPPARLSGRVRPYAAVTRARLAGTSPIGLGVGSMASHFLSPVVSGLARRLGSVMDGGESEDLMLRLRQSGLYPGLEGGLALDAYRVRQLGAGFAWLGGTVMVAMGLELAVGRALALTVLGGVIGLSRQRGRLDRAIETRRQRMRIEIYTINQLLAMRVRAGGGVVHAVSQVVARGSGEVVGELAEALRLHRAGMRAADAFARIAQVTPEPECARTYSLLGAADERGADLGGALLALAEDVREGRREALRRAATKRRAAMLIPIIGILAPVMLLFVGAPLPQILFNWR